MTPAGNPVDPSGPAFVSYRQSDGTRHAAAMSWALRASGVPVWQDVTDLPPGETSTRLDEALAAGLSAAVLVVTEELAHSDTVRDVEVPRLRVLAADPRFTFAIANAVDRPGLPGKPDYGAPDRVLRLPTGDLRGHRQDPLNAPDGPYVTARWIARRRAELLRPRVEGAGGTLVLDVQTRVPPHAFGNASDLVLRLRPPLPGKRRPGTPAMRDLQAFLAELPHLLSVAGATALRITGGAHLSVAFALGAAVPTTVAGRADVVDARGDVWAGPGPTAGARGGARLLRADPDRGRGFRRGGPVLMYLDLVPGPNDAPYTRLLAARRRAFSGALVVRAADPGSLDPDDSPLIAAEAAAAVRGFAADHGTAQVHLLLRCPWPVAVHLGRAANTLTVTAYEYDDDPGAGRAAESPMYEPVAVVRPGAGGSPLSKVLGGTAPPSPAR